ncbi:MAG: amidohydrolase [Asgard group archaeon]|nr:amidohydrolase [Asgard group archaeon]
MHPELGFEEIETSKLVAKKLSELGIEIQTGVAKTGVIGIIRGSNKSGKTIGIRADMDALALQEENDVPYKSKIDGKMHACGHDAHTAILIGVAKILVKLKDKINGNIKLFFQPAEEGLGGAKPMVKENALENPTVSAAIALHVDDETNVGTIRIKDGNLTASCDEFWIDIEGKGGHAAYPHDTIDPIVIGSSIVTAFQTIVSRNISPLKSVVVSVCTFNSGTAFNIIPETARLTGTVRTLDEKIRDETHEHMKRIVKGIEQTFGAKINITIQKGYSSGFNDASLNALIKESTSELVGDDKVLVNEEATMGAEDFFEFSDNYRLPVAMFWLGSRNEEKGITHPGHNPKFDIDEDALPLGSSILALTAIKYLEKV